MVCGSGTLLELGLTVLLTVGRRSIARKREDNHLRVCECISGLVTIFSTLLDIFVDLSNLDSPYC